MKIHFLKLLDDLPKIRHVVDSLDCANTEDDRPIKFAIVGYSYHQPTAAWGREELNFVVHRRDEVANFGPHWIEFVCLAAGYMLGLYQSKYLTEQEFALFEVQLPGFMWLHARQFTEVGPDASAAGAE